eukprot:250440-Prymnesium_polylepis.1
MLDVHCHPATCELCRTLSHVNSIAISKRSGRVWRMAYHGMMRPGAVSGATRGRVSSELAAAQWHGGRRRSSPDRQTCGVLVPPRTLCCPREARVLALWPPA